jgi:hypothetical protein
MAVTSLVHEQDTSLGGLGTWKLDVVLPLVSTPELKLVSLLSGKYSGDHVDTTDMGLSSDVPVSLTEPTEGVVAAVLLLACSSKEQKLMLIQFKGNVSYTTN